MAEDFSKAFGTKEYEAYRLLQTESAFMMEQGTLAAYKEDGVDKYQFLATLDTRTSDVCRDKDGEIYAVKDAVTGVNYPPLHVFCRSTTVPYYEESIGGTRAARDSETGKTIRVSADMTYKDWYNKYIKSRELPKKLKVDDSYLPIQLNFKDEKGALNFIPRNTVITDVNIIAGADVSVTLRVKDRLARQYGGHSEDWQKKVGKIESDKYVFDIHWVEHPNIGSKEYKIAGKKVKQWAK